MNSRNRLSAIGRLPAQYSLKWPNSAILCIFSYNAKQFDFPKTSGEWVKNVVRVGFEISIVPGITKPAIRTKLWMTKACLAAFPAAKATSI
jgi:hypothetical protein